MLVEPANRGAHSAERLEDHLAPALLEESERCVRIVGDERRRREQAALAHEPRLVRFGAVRHRHRRPVCNRTGYGFQERDKARLAFAERRVFVSGWEIAEWRVTVHS